MARRIFYDSCCLFAVLLLTYSWAQAYDNTVLEKLGRVDVVITSAALRRGFVATPLKWSSDDALKEGISTELSWLSFCGRNALDSVAEGTSSILQRVVAAKQLTNEVTVIYPLFHTMNKTMTTALGHEFSIEPPGGVSSSGQKKVQKVSVVCYLGDPTSHVVARAEWKREFKAAVEHFLTSGESVDLVLEHGEMQTLIEKVLKGTESRLDEMAAGLAKEPSVYNRRIYADCKCRCVSRAVVSLSSRQPPPAIMSCAHLETIHPVQTTQK
jgi:hypothetical protein